MILLVLLTVRSNSRLRSMATSGHRMRKTRPAPNKGGLTASPAASAEEYGGISLQQLSSCYGYILTMVTTLQ